MMEKAKSQKLFKLVVVGLSAVLLGAVHFLIPGFYFTLWRLAVGGDIHGAVEFLKSFGSSAMWVSFLILVLFNAVGFLPNFFLLAANGMLFGLAGGVAMSWAGECLGAVIGFFIMRTTLRSYALSALAKAGYLKQVDEYGSHKGFWAILLTRALPYVPSGLVTAAGALSTIRFRDYLFGTLLGKLPSTVIEVMVGHDLADYRNHVDRLAVLLSVGIVAYILTWRLKRRTTAQSSLE